jgi:hypothetical protein
MAVDVHDGETISIPDAGMTQQYARVDSINAPELKQAFSIRSHHNLSGLVVKRNVAVVWNENAIPQAHRVSYHYAKV